MAKFTITCIHCGAMFQVDIGGNQNGSASKQHTGPGGCGKNTQVYYKNGEIYRTS